ncbi:hypothetical protein BLIG_00751 [Bifidobacterium longum subsp. infantis CCUG 52486]|uniref:Uncharacterized protein n=1 Tax=Bifidobacterium longum subsp. infantis CCUG 52486 TaxID=537937 RepID=C5E9V6_BIFLI|nr:hypothetical protein BLIG_00751 [Bifidobacterium longum subsp. infantis CCUG 52486]
MVSDVFFDRHGHGSELNKSVAHCRHEIGQSLKMSRIPRNCSLPVRIIKGHQFIAQLASVCSSIA